MNTKELLNLVYSGQCLSKEQSSKLFSSIFNGEVDERELAGMLIGMKVKGETSDEIAGAALSMREFALAPDITETELFDTCGTGGDGKHSFNVSSAVAIILNSLGQKIAKHGNRSVSSISGSADFYEALGVPIALKPEEAAAYFSKTGFLFLFAQTYHPAMKYAGPVRKALATRTIFNFLGPLTNPLKLKRQMIGVYNKDFLPLYSESAKIIGYDRLVLYSSADGMDEVSPYAITHCVLIEGEKETAFDIDPSSYITAEEADTIPAKYNAQQNAELFVKTMSEKTETPLVKLLALNAALALYTLGKAESVNAGVAMAKDEILSGRVADTIAKLKQVDHVLI